ncbi:MAG: hypothetical protein AB7Y46_04290 [Armatimonadota bacterium]
MTVRYAMAMLLALSAGAGHALVIDPREIGISKMIPASGDTVTWRVPVVNDTQELFEGDVTMTMRVARRGEALGEPVAQTQTLTLEAAADEQSLGGRADVSFEWTPSRNGWYRVVFEIPGVCRVEREIAVTQRDLWFAWFGAPQQFRWCNVPTTVKDEDEAWWLRRGAIPAHWKGGVCYQDRPVEWFVQSWGAHDWIAIDEVGGPGEATDKFIAAWRELHARKPDQWIGVWYMGAHAYWAEIADLVDLFLPEIYLNYRQDHLGQFDAYLRTARAAGVIDRTLPALGINQRKDARGLVIVSPTREDVLRQVRYLKRTAPELRGLAFFNSGACAPGVAEYADELCGRYYVQPVLTIENVAEPIALTKDGTRATASIRNVGGMDAEAGAVEWCVGRPEAGARLVLQRLPHLGVGERTAVSVRLPGGPAGWPLQLRIVPGETYTVLDGRAQLVRDPSVPQPEYAAAFPAGGAPVGSPPTHERDGERLVVTNDAWRVGLDLAADAIASIVPAGGGEILREPWVLSAAGHEGIGEARMQQQPGALAVTIPWDSPHASGESQYIFFRESRAIRIARVWRPKGEVTLSGAGDRCGLFQRGGTYALQPGVGGPVRRGSLQDGDRYRDLLFGYLGEHPRPDNADRAGWIDFSYGDASGGMGVAIDCRWAGAAMKSYDVTRLYDGADWLEVLYVWGTEATFAEPQTSCIWLLPHGPLDLADEAVTSPAQALWRYLHAAQLAVAEGLPEQ